MSEPTVAPRKNRANCHACIHRRSIPGDCHISCANQAAIVKVNPHGLNNGWAYWPFNFDPIWIESCDGCMTREEQKEALSVAAE